MSSTSYFVCCCLYIKSICMHFKWTLDNYQEITVKSHGDKIPGKRQHPNRIKHEINQSILLHTKSLELVFMINISFDFFSNIFSLNFLPFSIIIAFFEKLMKLPVDQYFHCFHLLLFISVLRFILWNM